MRWTSFFAGIAALTMLDVVLSSGASAARAGGALSLVSSAITHVMSPASPLIPDLRTGGSTAASSSSSTSSSSSGAAAVPASRLLAPTSAAAAAALTRTA